MAGFRMHISTSAVCGALDGGLASVYGHCDWGVVILGAGLTTLGGMLPDLDSDSGVPVRELSSLSAATTPILLLPRLQGFNLSAEQTLVILAGIYLFIRYVMSRLFKRMTVHRGMYHSLPAMVIAGLIVFVLYHHDSLRPRLYLAVGIMIGFLSHLILDEMYAVDLHGVVPRLNAFAGSAVKLTSKSWLATGLTYTILLGLGYIALQTIEPQPSIAVQQITPRPVSSAPLRFPPG